MNNRFDIQDEQYKFPYHHLVSFENFKNYEVMSWGFEYYAYITRVMGTISELKPKSILGIGCGEGKMILELSRFLPKGVLMKGVDLSERAIYFAKAFNWGNGSVFDCIDVKDVNDSFDVITLVETMEHIPDDAISHVVNNVSRLLKPNGRLIVTVPASNFPVLSKHYRHYDLEMLKMQFKGFKLESSEYLVKQGFVYWILIRLSRKFCSFGFIRKSLFKLAEIFVFNAKPSDCRHILCVFSK